MQSWQGSNMKQILLNSNDTEVVYSESESFIIVTFLDFIAVLHRDIYSVEMLRNSEIELVFRKFI
jgi:hypothetical protein